MADFDKVINRKNTDSVKWNGMDKVYGSNDLLPMWVADTDFEPPQQVLDALKKRIDHGIFGYAMTSKDYAPVIKNWVNKRYKWEIEEDWIVSCAGVVKSIAFSIQALTEEGDNILIQTPIYPPFVNMIKRNNRMVVRNPLLLEDGKYTIDFDDFEKKLQDGVKLFILCSPHNPVGRVWTTDELQKMAELCQKYHVPIVSDEIHADIIYKPHVHTSIASINDDVLQNTVTLIAPSKTFNIPGLQSSIMIIPNPEMRKMILEQMGKVGFHGANLLGMIALEEAYKHGEEWLEELLVYLNGNIALVNAFIEKELPQIKVIPTEGMYLVWLDLRELGLSDKEIQDRLVQKGKLALEPGTKYGPEGSGFVRMNIGCPRSLVVEGLNRLKKAFE